MRSPNSLTTSSCRPSRRFRPSLPPRRQGVDIVTALGDGRLFVDPATKRVIYTTPAGDAFDAKTGAKVEAPRALRKVRLNNGVRRAIEAAMGALQRRLGRSAQRIQAAHDLFNNPNPKALAVVDAQLGRETDAAAKAALEQARAAIVAATPDSAKPDVLRAIAAAAARGDKAAENAIQSLAAQRDDPEVAKAADTAIATIERSLLLWGLAQNGWYGLSTASVLLLAAIGLAITFGVMGVINMAHGEMVMLGAYSTYVVQMFMPASLANWSIALALPLAFLVSAAGACHRAIRRTLSLHPAARHAARHLGRFADPAAGGAHDLRRNNRQVYSPPFLSARSMSAGLRSPTTGSGSSCWPASCSRRCSSCCAPLVRTADARGDAEPAHGVRHGHLYRGSTCSPSRSAPASQESRASR